MKNRLPHTAFRSAAKALFVCALVAVFLMAHPSSRYAKNVKGGLSLTENALSKVTMAKYKRDATRLFLRNMITRKHRPERADVNLDQKNVSPIFDVLLAIHQSSLPQATLVTQTHKIHTFPRPQVNQVIALYTRNAEWAKPLRMGERTTNHEELNTLLKKYQLRIVKSTGWNEQQDALVIKSREPLNMFALASQISALDGIHLVDLAVPSGDGNDIAITKIGKDIWEVNYFIKFGACINECTKQHVWTFHVDKNRNVDFVSEGGDPLPKWMN